MKAKKIIKKLDKAVAILADIIKQHDSGNSDVRTALDAAKASVVSAKAAVNSSPSPKTTGKPAAKAKRTKRKPVAASAGKSARKKAAKVSAPAKKAPQQQPVAAAKKRGLATKKRSVSPGKSAAVTSGTPVETAAKPAAPPKTVESPKLPESLETATTV